MNHRPPRGAGQNHDDDREIEAFAESFDETFRTAASKHPETRGLDPDLWNRIQARGSTESVEHPGLERNDEPAIWAADGRRFDPPRASTRFRWIAAAIVTLVLVGSLAQLIADNPDDAPSFGATVAAPLIASPVATAVTACDITPLTVDQVLALVLSVPATGGAPFPHTDTWLPDVNGRVETATGARTVHAPNATEFTEITRAVDQYLICQEEGMNFQLWSLESAYEVQRQVTEHLLQEFGDAFGPEIDEAMLVEEIERLGPLARQEVQIENLGGSYLTLIPQDDAQILRINQVRDASFITDDEPGQADRYAWAGLELRSKRDGSIIARHSAALEGHESDTPVDQTPPLVGTLILHFDPTSNAWKIEWFIPSV